MGYDCLEFFSERDASESISNVAHPRILVEGHTHTGTLPRCGSARGHMGCSRPCSASRSRSLDGLAQVLAPTIYATSGAQDVLDASLGTSIGCYWGGGDPQRVLRGEEGEGGVTWGDKVDVAGRPVAFQQKS
jgi:hypothetical protein